MAEALLERHLAPAGLSALLAEQRRTGSVPRRKVERMASAFGVDRATVYRWLAAGRVPTFERPSYAASDADVEAFFDYDGRFRAAWQARCRQLGGPEVFISYDTYRRAITRRLGPALRAYAREGRRAAEAQTARVPQQIPERNFLWVIDHKQLDVPVIPSPYHRTAAYPWLTSVIDVYSRAVLGWVLSMRPTRAEVVKALADACTSRPERGPFAGGPLNVFHDNAPELNAEITTQACVLLGADALPRRVWSPEPFIERYHRTIDQQFQVGLPFNRLGPRRKDGTVYGPDCEPMPLTAMRDLWEQWVTHFNLVRVHRTLGMTPAEKFLADDTLLRPVSDNDIRLLQVERKHTRQVRPEGIEFRGRLYFHPDITRYMGETVEIGEWPHDALRIDAFIGGQYLFTAELRDQASPELIAAALQQRKQPLDEGRGHRTAKSRRDRLRLRALHAGSTEPVVTNAMTEQQAMERRRALGHIDLGSPADVLGITVNQPREDGQ